MLKIQKNIYWTLLALISLAFLLAGSTKVTGQPSAVAGFVSVHLPIWFMYVVGTLEILGAIGLWIPRLSRYAIGGLSIILLGAIVTTAIFQGIAVAFMPLIYLLIFGVIVWMKSLIQKPQ
jgi:putative oxidoreductase